MRKYQSQKKQYHHAYHPKPGQMAQIERVRLPRGAEVFGHVVELCGGKRMIVNCSDEKRRMCKVPGKLRKIWIKLDNFVLVDPWPIEGDSKGNIAWRYKETEVDWLKQHGYLKGL